MSSLEDRAKAGRVIGVWREPFSLDAPKIQSWREGVTIGEVVARAPWLPEDFEQKGEVRVNGELVPRGAWHLVKPKATSDLKPISVTFHMPVAGGRSGGGSGGGGSSKKSTIGIVAAIALLVITTAISGGALGPAGLGLLGSSFGAGGLGATLLAAGVSIAGSLAIAALTAPPAQKQDPQSSSSFENAGPASADGNQISPGGAISRVIGTRKVFPQLAGQPVIELVGEDEYVEAVYILAGPHALNDIRVSNSPIVDAEDIEYETKEGWDADTAITLVTRQGRTLANQMEIKGHVVAPNAQTQVWDEADPASDSPKWQAVAARRSPDQVWLHFLMPEGLRKADSATAQITVPLRIRMRQKGASTWINLPELHYSSNQVSQRRLAVVLKWYADPVVSNFAYTENAFIAAHHIVPNQTIAPYATGWTAHSYFSSGSSTPLYAASITGATTGCQHVYLNGGNIVIMHLDPATFPKGLYEFEIKRGAAFLTSNLVRDSYLYSGTMGAVVYDFFGWHTSGGTVGYIPLTKDQLSDKIFLARTVSIWDEHPLPQSGFATIAIKAKNRSVDQLSVVASGYVRDWNGSAWSSWTTTSNPAPHFVDILSGDLNADPLPDALRDDTELVTWRTKCIANNYTCDLIVENQRMSELLTMVASCGYARPYQSDKWGVTRDYNRSADSPIQVFSPRNASNFKFSKAFPRLPDGFRVRFRRDDEDYDNDEMYVWRDGVSGDDSSRLELITIDGLIDETKVAARALFDLRQAQYRATFYSFQAAMDTIVCRRGSLVAIQHDILMSHSAYARIRTVNKSAGNIVSVYLDSKVQVYNGSGNTTGMAIRRTDGTISTHVISTATSITDLLVFTTAFADDTTTGSPFDPATISEVAEGCLVVIGPVGSEYIRAVVSDIAPGKDLTATITCVDEAPELWA